MPAFARPVPDIAEFVTGCFDRLIHFFFCFEQDVVDHGNLPFSVIR